MVSNLLNNDNHLFWKEMGKLNSCNSIETNIINGTFELFDIANLAEKAFLQYPKCKCL